MPHGVAVVRLGCLYVAHLGVAALIVQAGLPKLARLTGISSIERMAKHKPAAYTSRDNPIFMEFDARTLRLSVDGPHPSSSGKAKAAPLVWTVEVDGGKEEKRGRG